MQDSSSGSMTMRPAASSSRIVWSERITSADVTRQWDGGCRPLVLRRIHATEVTIQVVSDGPPCQGISGARAPSSVLQVWIQILERSCPLRSVIGAWDNMNVRRGDNEVPKMKGKKAGSHGRR